MEGTLFTTAICTTLDKQSWHQWRWKDWKNLGNKNTRKYYWVLL